MEMLLSKIMVDIVLTAGTTVVSLVGKHKLSQI